MAWPVGSGRLLQVTAVEVETPGSSTQGESDFGPGYEELTINPSAVLERLQVCPLFMFTKQISLKSSKLRDKFCPQRAWRQHAMLHKTCPWMSSLQPFLFCTVNNNRLQLDVDSLAGSCGIRTSPLSLEVFLKVVQVVRCCLLITMKGLRWLIGPRRSYDPARQMFPSQHWRTRCHTPPFCFWHGVNWGEWNMDVKNRKLKFQDMFFFSKLYSKHFRFNDSRYIISPFEIPL